jgi:hypothetical protein
MTSIDKEQDDEKRFLFNRPFGFIVFRIYDCHAFLEKELDWNDKLFIWLDYDSNIDDWIIGDTELVAAKAKPFDIFIATVEAESPKEPRRFLEELYVPAGTMPKSIKEDFPQTLNSILTASIQNGLKNRTKHMSFLQLFNLIYQDTKKMYTFGGIFCDEDRTTELKESLSGLRYISHDNSTVTIDCPLLTPREKMYLDSCVQMGGIADVSETGLRKDDADKYWAYYKYYPQFFESIY